MSYHSHGAYWKPRTKKDLINCIIKSGRWNDTKSKLIAMDIKQIAGIYHRIRQDQFKDLMIRPKKISDNTNTNNEVENDRPNNDVRSS